MKKKISIITITLLSIMFLGLCYMCKPTSTGQFDPGNAYTLQLLKPEVNDKYYLGEELCIRWICDGPEYIKLELLLADEVAIIIDDITENDGEYIWIIPHIEISRNYNIKISIAGDFPYHFNIISSPFIIDNRWDDLGPVSVEGGYVVSIGLDDQDFPVLFYKQNFPGKNKICITQWDGLHWEMIFEKENELNFSSLAWTISQENEVFFAYIEDVDKGPCVEKQDINEPTWQDFGDAGESITGYYQAGVSLALNNDNYPVVSYFIIDTSMNLTGDRAYLISACWDGRNWNFLGNPDSHTIEEDAIDSIDVDIMLGFELIFDQSPYCIIPVYTSLIMIQNENEQSIPVIAYIDYQKFGEGYRKQVSVRAWDTNSGWYQVGEIFGEINSYYPSIAAGDNNLPVVCYLTGEDNKKTMVKKWSGSHWIDLHFPEYCETGFPSITVGEDNNPIVASSSGVFKWNGRRWITLGYPNFPGGGTGQPSWWITESDSAIFIAFIDPEDTDLIQVKMLPKD